MFGEIEDAVLAKIRQAQESVFRYRYETMLVLNGSDESPLIAGAVRRFPALWLAYDSHDADPVQDGEGLHLNPRFVLFMQARSLFNQSLTRQQAVPGLYQMMLDNAGLLTGETFGKAIAPLQLIGFEILRDRIDNGSALATGRLSFKTRFTIEPQEEQPVALQHFIINWLHHDQTVTGRWPKDAVGDASSE